MVMFLYFPVTRNPSRVPHQVSYPENIEACVLRGLQTPDHWAAERERECARERKREIKRESGRERERERERETGV